MALCNVAALIVTTLGFRATGGFQFKILGHHVSAGLGVRAGFGVPLMIHHNLLMIYQSCCL